MLYDTLRGPRTLEAIKIEVDPDPVLIESTPPPFAIDDLFHGLDSAKPILPEEGYDEVREPSFDESSPEGKAESSQIVHYHPRSTAIILRFGEAAAADRFLGSYLDELTNQTTSSYVYYRQSAVARDLDKGIIYQANTASAVNMGLLSVYMHDDRTMVLATEKTPATLTRWNDQRR